MLLDSLMDVLIDSLKILPFLFLTYVIIEYIEHITGEGFINIIKNKGILGSVIGSILGAVPQCGFSAAASNLYAGRIITIGTLISIYLSTSDEMLPIMLSSGAPLNIIGKIILLKIFIGIIAGVIIDLLFFKRLHIHEHDNHIHDDCEEEGFMKSAIKHTLNVFLFIFIISLALNVTIETIGIDNLSKLTMSNSYMQCFITALIGLIPNCAASVIITNLYLQGALSFGSMMAGLLSGAGVGLLVLFKVNKETADNIKIVSLLYCSSVLTGILIMVLGI